MAFALTPATAVTGVLDYTTRDHAKIYSSGSKGLSEEPYDCTPDGLFDFLETLGDRARECGWADPDIGLLYIPEDPLQPDTTTYLNLLTHYGQVELEEIRAHAETYIATPCRSAQDATMLYQCIMASISKEGKDKIRIWSQDYKIGSYVCGPLLLKVLIRESHLDTNATTTSIRRQLTELHVFLPTIGNDITKFNQHVQLLMNALTARGETTNDLLSNLFKGYLAASDKVFVLYMTRKQEEYEEGKTYSPKMIMSLANTKYKTLKQKGEWNAPTAEEEKILALEAQMEHMKKGVNKGKKHPKSADKAEKPKGGQDPKPNWLKHNRPPPQNEVNKSRNWNSLAYHWCHKDSGGKCPGIWRRHNPKECKGIASKKREAPKKKPATNETKVEAFKKRKLQLSKAYASVIEEEGDDESE
jgi:hypothetical protein